MDWQQVVSVGIVVMTTIVLGKHLYTKHRRAKQSLCGHSCGCSESTLSGINKEALKQATPEEQ